jgi:hypothetical protein
MILAALTVAAALSQPYDSMDAAAVAAEQATEPASFLSGYEYGGLLLEKNGKFFYTAATTSHSTTSCNLGAAFTSDYKFVALWHTHPGQHETSRWFSDADTAAATRLKVVSYIGIEFEKGAVRKFVPGANPAPDILYGKIVLGELVGPWAPVAVHYATVTYGNVAYRVRGEPDPKHYLAEGPNGHLYFIPKEGSEYTP